MLMSRSLPGFADNSSAPNNQSSFDNESVSDSDSESEDNGKCIEIIFYRFFYTYK